MPTQKCFDELLTNVNLNQRAKNQVISLICSGDMVDKNSGNLIDWEHFDPHLKNKNVLEHGIFAGRQHIIA